MKTTAEAWWVRVNSRSIPSASLSLMHPSILSVKQNLDIELCATQLLWMIAIYIYWHGMCDFIPVVQFYSTHWGFCMIVLQCSYCPMSLHVSILLSCCVTISYCLFTVLLSYCLTVLLSYCLTVSLSHCPTVSLSVFLSYCLTVLMPCCLAFILSYYHTVLLSHCPSVLLSCNPTAMLSLCF